MRNVKLVTLAKIIIPLILALIVMMIIVSFVYNSVKLEVRELLYCTVEYINFVLDPKIVDEIEALQSRSDRIFTVFITVIGIGMLITLAALFAVTKKLTSIKNIVRNATKLSKEDIEKSDATFRKDEIGELTKEFAYKIRDLNKLNEELAKSVEIANVASKAKSDFLSHMSHEIRTPMNAIIGMTNIAKSADSLEKKNCALGKIDDAAKHLLGIINDILDMSKIEANMLELHPEAVIFEDMLKRVINIINYQAAKKHQKLSVCVDVTIPHAFVCDAQRLAQVVTNLLYNAVKFTPENGYISLDVELLDEGDDFVTIQFTVTDSGIGINGDQISKLFDAFEQVKSSIMNNCGGTGLGLPISQRIVNMMGGDIHVESVVGEGSVFTFSIKAKKPDERAEDDSFPKEKGAINKTDITDIFYGYCALLVEDVDINREIVTAVLEPTLLEIDSAENGEEAVQMYLENPDKYNIIFMDLQMPVKDGYEATRAIRAHDIPSAAEIPIIAMTANVFKDDIENCLAAGMNDHLGKPLDFNDMLRVLRHYLSPQAPAIVKDRRVKQIGERKDLDRRKGG